MTEEKEECCIDPRVVKLPYRLTSHDEDKINEFMDKIKKGEEFPPVTLWVNYDNELEIFDGVHRFVAMQRLGKECIPFKWNEKNDRRDH